MEPRDQGLIALPANTTSNEARRWANISTKSRRGRIEQFIRQWRWPLAIGLLSIVGGIVMWIYRKEFFQALERLSKMFKAMGAGGYVLMSLLIILSAFPPMVGYGTYQTLSGFTFGFARGFPVSYFSALAGSVACFVLSRRFLKQRVRHLMSRYPNLEAVVYAVEKKGFKLFLLIRISPYPFNLLNVLFATTSISTAHYAAGTALSLLKIALHVYIGANLTSLASHILGNEDELTEGDRQANLIRMIAIVVGSVTAFGVMAYIYFVAKRVVAEANQDDTAESMAFLNADGTENTNLEEWADWTAEDEESARVNKRVPRRSSTDVPSAQS